MGARQGNIGNILLVEDNAKDLELTLAALEEHHLANNVAVVRDGEKALDYLYRRKEFKERMGGNPIVVLLDLKMPKISGLEVLKIMKADENLKIIPVVVLSSSRETPDLAECYKHGVNAFVVKPVKFTDFMEAVKHLGIFWAAVNEQPPLVEKEERDVQKVMEVPPITTSSPHILHLEDDPNDAVLVQGALEAEGIDCTISRVQNRHAFMAALERGGIDLILSDFSLAAFDGLSAAEIVRHRWPNIPVIFVSGTLGEESAIASLKRGATDYVLKKHLSRLGPAVRRALMDVKKHAELEQLEAVLIESQKMEVLGQLAGGAAHDFNNVLSVIMGYSDLLASALDPKSPLQKYTECIKHASKRAVGLTRQLLVFSRKQTIWPVVLDINRVVEDLEQMLRQLIDENIEMTVVTEAQVGSVRADSGYVGQVLMNLAVNARDAMPFGGKLTIRTNNRTLDQDYAQGHTGVVPGDYVMLSVSDTGAGMTPEVKARLFEAFFTTKPRGKGTGLGLHTCKTIVEQSGGHICFCSEVGQGTTFSVYFPRVEQPARLKAGPVPIEQLPRGTETLLVVEDDPSVRQVARTVLEGQGYQVLLAPNGQRALHVAREHKGPPIRLVIADVIMPVMSGNVMAAQLKSSHPDLKVLFTSGYADDAMTDSGVLEAGVEFLPKPYTRGTLALRVRDLLDRPKTEAHSEQRVSAFHVSNSSS